ncbi:ABC transporter substrate-binding protein [Desertihabitans aurantiacus]|uniref:ABC transporter substrate-binding protein n=1 Tax=Desertihabitans aurantiacus TaxID=2282477 RepID=UPI000DF82447|nr:ABC transporter substrate-binding protein [Desertihabitans aurantiacus]
MPAPALSRRALIRSFAVASGATALTSLTACAVDTSAPLTTSADALADPTWPLPDEVPPGTTLTVGDPTTQKALELSGLAETLSFPLTWANLSGGPQTSEAFRAGALDLGSVAEIPGINAHWTDLATKFVASKYRADPLAHPIYQLALAPGAGVSTLADLRGKRIAYSPSQAQGALVIRVLAKAGLGRSDVTLVEIPSTGDVYPNALASRQVDVAPVGGTAVKRYLEQYEADGATAIAHGLRDDAAHLYAPASVLQDQAKAAAVAEYVRVWARAQQWIQDHPQEWIEGYYVADQRLSPADGEYLVDAAGTFDIPADWTDAVARTQETVDLLAEFTGQETFDAGLLFDRRFDAVAADALATDGADR